MLNLKHLYYFHVYAHLLNTAEAARKLGISSPALSNQLKDLEIFIGSKLTRRVDGKVEITETGEIVLNYTDQMFSIYETLKMQLNVANDFKTTNFRIGVCPDLGARFSFDLISLMEKPQLSVFQKVHVKFDSSENLMSEFKNQYDLVLGAFEPTLSQESSWISQSFTFPVKLFAPASVKNAFLKKNTSLQNASLTKIIEFANEMNLSWVLPMQPSILRQESDRLLQTSQTSPTRTIECNSSAAIVQLIERGFAMGFVPTPCLLDFKSAHFLTLLGPNEGFWSHRISLLALKQESLPDAKSSSLQDLFTNV